MPGPFKSRPEGTTGSMADASTPLGDPNHSDGEVHTLGSTVVTIASDETNVPRLSGSAQGYDDQSVQIAS